MVLAFPQSYIVWDLETTGLNPQTCHILEVAVAIVRNGDVVEKWSALLNHDIEIDPLATNVHGITREMCAKDGKPPKEVIQRLLRNILDSEAHVTHNGSQFDLKFLDATLNALGFEPWPRLELHHIDTAALYKADRIGEAKRWREDWDEFFNRVLSTRVPGLKYNVGICCDNLGISREGVEQHRALADVLLTNEIYKKLIV